MASLIWLGKAFAISLIGMAGVAALLGRYTVWGRQFLRISAAYFNPRVSLLPLV